MDNYAGISSFITHCAALHCTRSERASKRVSERALVLEACLKTRQHKRQERVPRQAEQAAQMMRGLDLKISLSPLLRERDSPMHTNAIFFPHSVPYGQVTACAKSKESRVIFSLHHMLRFFNQLLIQREKEACVSLRWSRRYSSATSVNVDVITCTSIHLWTDFLPTSRKSPHEKWLLTYAKAREVA